MQHGCSLWIWMRSLKTPTSIAPYPCHPCRLRLSKLFHSWWPQRCREPAFSRPTALPCGAGLPTASQPCRSWSACTRRAAEMGAGWSQVLREGWTGAQAGGCTCMRLPCLREKKCKQKEQALGHSFIYQYWHRHRDPGTSQFTANYFLLLFWQATRSFLVSFVFAPDLITAAPKSVVLVWLWPLRWIVDHKYMLHCKTKQT